MFPRLLKALILIASVTRATEIVPFAFEIYVKKNKRRLSGTYLIQMKRHTVNMIMPERMPTRCSTDLVFARLLRVLYAFVRGIILRILRVAVCFTFVT